MELKFVWIHKTGNFQTGEYLYLNKICVGGYSWNSARRRDDSINWIGEYNAAFIENRLWLLRGRS